MWNIGWIRLATLGTACLMAGQLLAAPATQPAGTQSATTRPALHFSLATSAYPAGITSEEQYQQYLANELREAKQRIGSGRGDDANQVEWLLQAATFALTQASEPDLTRVWLWRQPQAEPELAVRALEFARDSLAATAKIPAGQAPHAHARADRIRVLNALLAMEGVLLAKPGRAEALRAADLADAAAEAVPSGAEATWELLIAGCLEKAGQQDDAQLRLQRLLRRHKGSAQAVAAVMLQVRMLAEAGDYAAGIGLISEYLEAMPATVNQSVTAPTTQSGDEAPGVAMRASLSLLRARLLAEWTEKIEGSTNELDRQGAGNLRKQALKWQEKAETQGPHLIRLLPMLQELEQGVK